MTKKRRPSEKRLKVIRSQRAQMRQRIDRNRERVQRERAARKLDEVREQTPPIGEAEELISRLAGVKRARVEVEDGLIRSIHVVTDSRWSWRQVRFMIRTALSARYGFFLPDDVWINQAKFDDFPAHLNDGRGI